MFQIKISVELWGALAGAQLVEPGQQSRALLDWAAVRWRIDLGMSGTPTGATRPPEGHDPLPKLDALLRTIVTRLTKALEVVRVEEQRFIALMRLDVIGDCCCLNYIASETEATQGLIEQLVLAQGLPSAGGIQMLPR